MKKRVDKKPEKNKNHNWLGDLLVVWLSDGHLKKLPKATSTVVRPGIENTNVDAIPSIARRLIHGFVGIKNADDNDLLRQIVLCVRWAIRCDATSHYTISMETFSCRWCLPTMHTALRRRLNVGVTVASRLFIPFFSVFPIFSRLILSFRRIDSRPLCKMCQLPL